MNLSACAPLIILIIRYLLSFLILKKVCKFKENFADLHGTPCLI